MGRIVGCVQGMQVVSREHVLEKGASSLSVRGVVVGQQKPWMPRKRAVFGGWGRDWCSEKSMILIGQILAPLDRCLQT